MRRETLIFDTSVIGHLSRRKERPGRYAHWEQRLVERVEAAVRVISVVTLAELHAGYLGAGWGRQKTVAAERMLSSFIPVFIDDPHLREWARLWVAARSRGIAVSDNDLWIAATAIVLGRGLVTCDRDHVRLAPDLPVEVMFLAPPV
jgi:predicted nucleic acid-binding protein